ncbi:hypothetical protein KKD19_02280 [Patescibacteria group bacterium]|nr:hypothetical protein [Patescibacteria group bacterium]MBU4512053.1 hypothetical protein [Patescibacteria group bacterium]MCG2693238.1 hypothetical protein [Candidatus Parcubacteria bacterium]
MDEALNQKSDYLKKDLSLVLALVIFVAVIVVTLVIIDSRTNYLSTLAHDLMSSIVGD